jgi:MoaA/NifB/PqqE/SkfB family radical SAM enzyme
MTTFTDLYYYANRLASEVPYRLLDGYAFPPLLCIVELTYRCNLRCDFCQFFQFQESPRDWGPIGQELTTEEIKRIIREAPGRLLSFTGGEITVRKDCRELLAYAVARRRLHVITNGLRVKEDLAREIAAWGCKTSFHKGLFALEMSIHGTGAVHDAIARHKGAYEPTIKTLAEILEHRRRVGRKHPVINVKMVVTEKNLQEIVPLYNVCRELGTDSFNVMALQNIDAHYIRFKGGDPLKSAQSVLPPPRLDEQLLREQLIAIEHQAATPGAPYLRYTPTRMTREEFIAYYRGTLDLRHYQCFAPWSKVFISSYGDIFTCPFRQIGNIRRESVREAWNNAVSKDFRRDLRRHRIYPGCLGCCNMERQLRAPAVAKAGPKG